MIIAVAGNWRCFTSWTARLIGETGGLSVAHEPLNAAWHDPAAQWPQWFAGLVRERRGLLHRYQGLNEELHAEDAAAVRELLRAVPEVYGGPEILRLMHAHYWELLREVWPGCRIVYCSRRLRSWLSAIARAPCSLEVVLQCRDGTPGWIEAGRRAAEGDEGRQALYIAGYYHLRRQEFNLRTLRAEAGGDYLLSDGEHLSAQYEVEIPRLLDYCGLPAPDVEELARHRAPPVRTWRHSRWDWRDVCEVAQRIESHEAQM